MSKTTCYFLVAAVLVGISLSAGAENYSQWSYFRDITLNTTAPACSIGVDVIKFPLLVRLDNADSNVFKTARRDGRDIRFSKFNSPLTSFPYQIEKWDSLYKQAVIWVLIDTIKKNSILPVARMYWGKANSPDSSKGYAVFDTAASRGFQTVFHMNEPNLGDTIFDATANRFKGLPIDTPAGSGLPANKVGKIGLGKEFKSSGNTSGGYYRILGSNTVGSKLNFDTLAAYSISAWVSIDSFNATRYILGKNQYNVFSTGSGNLAFSETRGVNITTNANKFVQNNDSAIGGKKNQWRYIVGVHMAGATSAMSLFIDGVLASSNVITASSLASRKTTYELMLGRRPDINTFINPFGSFSGIMDEVRLENAARNKDWIKLCYATQRSDTVAALELGAPMVMPPTALSYPFDSLVLKLDSAAVKAVPAYTGIVDSFTIAPLSSSAMPAGLSFDKSSGAISGTPTVALSFAKFLVTAINAAGIAKDTISISVVAPAIAPSIASQSGNLWVSPISQAAFWVNASGTAPLTYAWKKNGVLVAAAKKDTIALDTVRRADDGSVFLCSVTNSAGTAVSAPCTVHVVTAAFNATPVAGFDTLTVAFSDSSSGTSPANPLVRTWRFGDGDSSMALSPAHFYSKPGTYTAKLFVSCRGTTDSTSKIISVKNSILSANFKADTLVASGALTVIFSDSSKGTVFTRKWLFGDGAVLADTGKRTAVVHTFDSIGSFSVKMVVYGPSGSDSMIKNDYIVIRPDNPIRLKARPIAENSILLTWDQVKGVDSIRIVYTPVKPIPRWTDIVPTDLFKKVVSTTAVADTIPGLKSLVPYYFGAQIYAQGFWSFFTDSSTTAATLYSDTDIVVFHPEIYIKEISFDTLTNVLSLRWRTDTLSKAFDSMEVGVFWSTRGYLADAVASAESIRPDTLKKNVRSLDSMGLHPGEDFHYDSTYYFTILLRQSGKAWFPLTDSAKKMFTMPSFIRQNVKYGVNNPIVFVDDNRVRISINPATFSTENDPNTIARWKRPEALSGFIPVSEGYEFLSKYQSSPLNIGVKFTPPPKGRSVDQVKMYRFKNDQWFLDRNNQWHDTSEGYVGVTTGDITTPFIAMIDTMRPVISVVSRLDEAVPYGQPVTDEFIVTDNIANSSWNFQYAKGGFSFDSEHSDTGLFSKSENKKSTFIPGSLVSADQGVRAIMAVSDGVNTTFLNVSRRVIRKDGSQVLTTDSMKWVPLFVTSELENPGASGVLQALTGRQEATYDNTKLRLFRWFAFDGNSSNDSDKYIEYSAPLDSLFSFVPGRLLWIKTRQPKAINFGQGVTLDLTKPYPVTLQAHSWTDLALPFKFNIAVGDVLDSTKAGGHPSDSLRICKWTKDGAKNYVLDEFYHVALGVSALQDRSAVLEGELADGNGAGYSIYNPFGMDISCSFPPIPAAMSGYSKGTAKRTHDNGNGAIVITANTADGATANTIYCSLAPGKPAKRYFSAAPSLGGGVTLRVCDERMRQFGHVAATGAWEKGDGMSCPIAISNHGSEATIVKIVISGKAAPRGMRFMVYDQSTNKFVDSEDDGTLRTLVTAQAGETGFIHLVAGSDAYCAKVKADALIMKTELIGLYPNPFKRAVRIRFGLPFGFMGAVKFALYDPAGRQVWNTLVNGRSGTNDVVWSGKTASRRPAAAGLYILKMTALNGKGQKLGVFEKTVTYLP
jgi:PKD repeat protein